MTKRFSLAVAICFTAWNAQAAGTTQLSAPTGLKADVSKCEKVTLSWNAVKDATSYHIVVMSGGVGSEKDVTGTSISYDSMKTGTHSFKVKASGDAKKLRDSDYSEALSFEVKACETCKPPVVTLSMVTPNFIWPPNNKLVPVKLSGNVQTGCPLIAAGVDVMDEYGGRFGGPIPVPPTGGPFCATVMLEASRLGTDKDGRHYGIGVKATNAAGTGLSVPMGVVVPHDMGR